MPEEGVGLYKMLLLHDCLSIIIVYSVGTDINVSSKKRKIENGMIIQYVHVGIDNNYTLAYGSNEVTATQKTRKG